jgi:hypothetical protein
MPRWTSLYDEGVTQDRPTDRPTDRYGTNGGGPNGDVRQPGEDGAEELRRGVLAALRDRLRGSMSGTVERLAEHQRMAGEN